MKYICQVCGYVYDEASEACPFGQLPDSWQCPWCKAPKTQFKPEQAEAPTDAAADLAGADIGADDADSLKQLSPGQLAALCTNLARGCEKQYKAEESKLFAELAAYFTAAAPPAADAAGDRGAARALVWGEKVSRMLSSLVTRYLEEGEAMLEGTEIWICTACGFVYIGETPPELCPVCKVPSWKFEKIEGRR